MYTDIPFWLAAVFVVGGLAALAWSSDVFVDGAATAARMLGISPFIVGMVVIGFGTSAPELCVSVLSGASGHSSLSLGNAYGSCTFNIAAILGLVALILPLKVKPATAFVAGPSLVLISLASYALLADGACSRGEAFALLGAFLVLLPLYCWFDQKTSGGAKDAAAPSEPPPRGGGAVAALKIVVGLALLVGSSHILVWGAVDIAKTLHVSDLVIGLTVIAVGTSLPELASAVASARRGENEFVLGNIVGSNFFNSLAVVGLACAMSPAKDIPGEVLTRDIPFMAAMSLSIMLFGANWRNPRSPGTAGRLSGVIWVAVFVVYNAIVIWSRVAAGNQA